MFGANAGLGDIARRRKQIVKAFKYYRRALELDPTHPGAIIACAWCLDVCGDAAGAERYLTEGLKHATDTLPVRAEFAKLLDAQGRTEEAERMRSA
jgi:Flp pilus assembly protein TadD